VPVIAVIAGVGTGSAVTPINAWPATSAPLVRCMRAALADAGIGPEQVGAVYAAANGSTVVDRVEADALTEVFGGRPVLTTSIKGAIGEGGMAAAGSLCAAVLAGRRGLVVPTAGLSVPDPVCGTLGWVIGGAAALPAPYLLVNAIASGGALYSVVAQV